KAGAPLVLACEDEDGVTGGNPLAAVHGLLFVEFEGPSSRIGDFGFDGEHGLRWQALAVNSSHRRDPDLLPSIAALAREVSRANEHPSVVRSLCLDPQLSGTRFCSERERHVEREDVVLHATCHRPGERAGHLPFHTGGFTASQAEPDEVAAIANEELSFIPPLHRHDGRQRRTAVHNGGQCKRYHMVSRTGTHPVVSAGGDYDELAAADLVSHRRRVAASRQVRTPEQGSGLGAERMDPLVESSRREDETRGRAHHTAEVQRSPSFRPGNLGQRLDTSEWLLPPQLARCEVYRAQSAPGRRVARNTARRED